MQVVEVHHKELMRKDVLKAYTGDASNQANCIHTAGCTLHHMDTSAT